MEGQNRGIDPTARVHPSALLEAGVSVGARTAIWDHVHVRRDAQIGHDSILGEKTYVAYEVQIGDWVKLNAMVYICAGVVIEDGVMISAGTLFTNDRFPRAMDRTLQGLETSEVTEETQKTRVGRGVTVGAGAVIGPGLTLGPYAMVGMGSVVSRSVPPHALALGNPARVVGFVCACGPRLTGIEEFSQAVDPRWSCPRCGRSYGKVGETFSLLDDPHADLARLAP